MALPYELVDLIFSHVGSSTDTKNLRLACHSYSQIGLPHVFSPHFKCLPWRDDIARLRNISMQPHLRHLIKTVTFNLADLDEYGARHASFFDHWAMDPEDRNTILQDAWAEFYEKKESRKTVPELEAQGDLLAAALGDLPCLESVKIAYNECPYEGDVLNQTFERLDARKFDVSQATLTFEVLGRALARCSNLRSVNIDRFPVAMAWTAEPAAKEQSWSQDAKDNWDNFARSLEPGLSKLSISLDCTSRLLGAPFCEDAVRAAAALVTCSKNLTHLTITKHSYEEADADTTNDLLNEPLFKTYYPNLTDLELQGFLVDSDELLGFLARHAGTLRRVSLGGQGAADEDSDSVSEAGLSLRSGTWRQFFTGMQGLLPNLEKLCVRGFFTQSSSTGGGLAGEAYYMTPLGDDADDVNELEAMEWGFNEPLVKILDGAAFERFVMEGGDYPGW